MHFMSISTWDFGYSKLTTKDYTYMRFYLTNLSTGYVVRELFVLRKFDEERGLFNFSLKCTKCSKGVVQKVSILESLADSRLLEVAEFLSDRLTEPQMQALFKGLDNFV